MGDREAVQVTGCHCHRHCHHHSHLHLPHHHHVHLLQALGWVREMWGYCIGAASLGIKHRVLDGFQFEGGSIGNRERRLEWPTPAAPVSENLEIPKDPQNTSI